MTEWISVKDRLPEEYTAVLVYGSRGVWLAWLGSDNTWWDSDLDNIGNDITYWMPIPEPPKGEHE